MRLCFIIPVSFIGNGIAFTELHKILHFAIEHLRKTPLIPIIIDCLEYLALYNDFVDILKMLHILRDHVLLNNGWKINHCY
ncbi:DUF835 domain-containing protein [Thermococcus sp.]